MFEKMLRLFLGKRALRGNAVSLAMPWKDWSFSISNKKKTLAWLILL